MFDSIKKWFSEFFFGKSIERVFQYTLHPKEDMNKYVYARTEEERLLIIKRMCTPLIASVVVKWSVCIDFTGGAYGSSFLQKMAYELVDGVFAQYQHYTKDRLLASRLLKAIFIENTEDPSIVQEFKEYIEEASLKAFDKYHPM